MAITLPTQYTSLAVRSADAALQVQVDLKSVVDQINAAPAFNQAAVAITGGTINNTPIGGTTAAAGSFTTLTANFGVISADGGSSVSFTYYRPGVSMGSAGFLSWGPAGSSTADLYITRDAANNLAQRNGTAAQTFSLYASFTDASNFSRLTFDNIGACRIYSSMSGTGTVQELQFGVAGLQWKITTAGNFTATADNTYDIGATGANRARNIFAGTGFRANEAANGKQGVATLVAGTLTVANTNITTNSRIFLTSNTDGGTPGFLRVSARTAGTSFTILSSSGTDTSIVAYEIFEPA